MKIARGHILFGLVVGAAVIGYKIYKDSKTVRHGKLVKKTWTETVQVQEFREVTEKGKFVPDGAEVVSRSTKQSIDTSNVLNSLSNVNVNWKTGRVSLPQVKTETVYQYKVKKWVTVSTKSLSGNDSEPKRPEIALENEYKGGEATLGQRRIVASESKRGIVFADEEGAWHDLTVNDSDYHTLNAGDVVFYKKICGAYSLVGAEFGKKEDAGDEAKTEQGSVTEGPVDTVEPEETDIP